MNPWEIGVSCLTIVLTVAVLVRMWRNHLVKTYKLLTTYLAFDAISSIAALSIPFHTKYYGYFYFCGQTIAIVIAAFMLVEIWALALAATPALARLARELVGYLLGIAALVPLAALHWDHSAAAQAHPYIRTFFLFEQTVDGTMGLFLLAMSMFMAWFPVRLRRNVIVYISGFIVWSLSRSVLIHIINQWFNNKAVNQVTNILQMCIAAGCLLFWLAGLRREGESRTAIVGHLWNQDRAVVEKLTAQLQAINDTLERFRRK